MKSEKNDKERFRKVLQDKIEWPHEYMFKFIIPADVKKEGQIIELFPDDADVSFKSSRTGKYTSVTIKALMQSPDEVIQKYEEVGKIEGVMAL